MKLLVFAHTPPPHHGQSYMVQLMLNGFGGDRRRGVPCPPEAPYGIECYHVNARLSRHLEDIGDLRIGKMFLALGYCLQAIWCRYRYGVTNFYYIPAPGKRSALYRDWLVMAICRPFFKRLVLHWHAAGLAKWLETCVQIRSRSLTYRLLKTVDLSIVLSSYNRADAEKLLSQNILVVHNGIPDPCPDYEEKILPGRVARREARQAFIVEKGPEALRQAAAKGDLRKVQVLFLAHCTREKGLFVAVDAVLLANALARERGLPLWFHLKVAGTFVSEEEESEFRERVARPGVAEQVTYVGFVSGDGKANLLTEADLFCFPTCYANENQPVNLIEAMAYGLPVITTRWRSIPEMFPCDYDGLVPPQDPAATAIALLRLATEKSDRDFRQAFLDRFTIGSHLSSLAAALHAAERPTPSRAIPGQEPIRATQGGTAAE